MEFKCNKDDLLKSIKLISKVISNNELIILSNALLEITENKLYIYATNLKTYIKTFINIESNINKNILVNVDRLYSILSKIIDIDITCIVNDKYFTIKGKNIKYDLCYMKSNDNFPSFIIPDEKDKVNIEQKDFKEMIDNVMYSASDDSSLSSLSGILFEIKNNKIMMTSSDGKRLSHIERDNKIEKEISVIFPLEILKIVKEYLNNENMDFILNDKFIYMSFNNYEFYSSIIDGYFPSYEKLLLEIGKQKYKIQVDSILLREAIERISVLINKEKNFIYFKMGKNELLISSGKNQYGYAEEKIKCECDFENEELIFNYIFVLDFLKLEKNDVIIEFNNSISSVLFYNDIDINKKYIVMPIIENKND